MPERRAACASRAPARSPPSISKAIRRRTNSTWSRAFRRGPLAELGRCSTGAAAAGVPRFLERNRTDLYGVDIDADNVRWCSEHLNGHFARSSRIPRRRSAAISSSIYGIRFSRTFRAASTKRFGSPSCTGSQSRARCYSCRFSAVSRRHGAKTCLEQVVSMGDSAGFIDIGRNPEIDAVTQGSDYYRNVFHQPGYISRGSGKILRDPRHRRRGSSATTRISSWRGSPSLSL